MSRNREGLGGAPALECIQHGTACNIQGGLGINGGLKLVFRPLEAQLRKPETKDRVRLFKPCSRLRIGSGEVGAHTYLLGSLSREQKRSLHLLKLTVNSRFGTSG